MVNRKFRDKAFATLLSGCMLASTVTPVTVGAVEVENQVVTETESEKTKETMDYVEGEAVVMYKTAPNSTNSASSGIASKDVKVENVYEFEVEDAAVLEETGNSITDGETLQIAEVTSDTLSTEQLIAKLEKNQNVMIAEPNYIYHATDVSVGGTYVDYQWALDNKGQNKGDAGDDIYLEGLYNKTGVTGTERVVAIIDTGIDYTNVNLANNMWENTTSLAGNHGYDFANMDADPMDDNDHGTHCAGIIAGNGTEIHGVNENVKFMALKFLDSKGSGYLDDALAAYDYINRAMDEGVDVVAINNSWGGGESSEILEKVVDIVGAKGALSCCAAGNDGIDSDTDETWSFQSDYKIGVAAVNEKNEITSFSNYGKNTVELGAPGANILSTVAHPVYNPVIHDADQSSYSSFYWTFASQTEVDNLGIVAKEINGNKKPMQVEFSEDNSFGGVSDDTGSIKFITVDDYSDKIVAIPVTIAEAGKYNAHAMVKAVGDDGEVIHLYIVKKNNIENISNTIYDQRSIDYTMTESNANYWNELQGDAGYLEAGEYMLCFFVEGEGASEFYIDNVGVSKPNMSGDELGHLAFFNGTSMATPYVTGAAALLSECYKKEDGSYMTAAELKKFICDSVTLEESLMGITVTGGVLDFENLVEPKPMISAISYDDSKHILTLQGRNFGEETGKISVGDEECSVEKWSETQIEIAYSGKVNVNRKIEVTSKNNYTGAKIVHIKHNTYKIKEVGSLYPYWDDDWDYDYDDDSLKLKNAISNDYGPNRHTRIATNANKIYVFEGDYIYVSSKEIPEIIKVGRLKTEMVDKNAITTKLEYRYDWASNVVYYKGCFYSVVDVDAGYFHKKVVMAYHAEKGSFVMAAELPKEMTELSEISLAVMKEKVYVMGGIKADGTCVDDIYSCSVVPEKYFYYEEYYDEDEDYDEDDDAYDKSQIINSVANGESDEVVSVEGHEEYTPEELQKESITLPYATGKMAVHCLANETYVAGGYLAANAKTPLYKFTGTSFEVVLEDLELQSSKIKVSDNYLYEYEVGLSDYKNGVLIVPYKENVHGEMFVYDKATKEINTLPVCLYDYIKDDSFQGITAGGMYMFANYEDPEAMLYGIKLPVSAYQIECNSKNVYISGTGYYYKGETVSINISGKRNYYIKRLKVDGEWYDLSKFEKNNNCVVFKNVKADHKIEVYTDEAAHKFSFGKKVYTAYAGTNLDLKCKVYPTTALDQMKFKVSDKNSYVDKKGILHISKNAGGKDIKVTARYTHSNGKFEATVHVKKKSTAALNKKNAKVVRNGSIKLSMKVDNKVQRSGIVWSSSDSRIATVSSTGQVIGMAYGTVTITAKLTDGSGMKASCKVTVIPRKVSRVKAASAANAISLRWRKISGVSGYKVYQYKNGKYVCVRILRKASATKTIIRGLKKNTSYKFKVIAYKDKINGKENIIKAKTLKN